MSVNLHVLVLPSWYPTRDCPVRGVFFRQQAIALHKTGIKVGVIYPNFRSLRELKIPALAGNHFQTNVIIDKGIPTYYYHGWNVPRLRLEPLLWKWHSKKMFNLYKAKYGTPDLIHAHNILWAGVSAMEIAQSENIPYMITEHASNYVQDIVYSWQKPYIRKAINNAAVVLAVSKTLAGKLMTYSDRKRIEVIPNMVDTGFFVFPPVPRKVSPFCFLTVARLNPKKGLDLLIKAFARAFSQENDVFLEIGGDGEQRAELESLVKNLRLNERVSFLGELSLEQVREAMWHANAFVLPSYVETFGVVLIEAMATGLPVIATACGGPEEIIKPDTGLLVEPGNVVEMSKALKNVYEHRFELRKKELAVRNYIVDYYSDKVIAKRLLEYYDQVLDAESNGRNR
ncbi:MAG: glycosyltransferase family 4 protein [Acetomicrobium sp.]